MALLDHSFHDFDIDLWINNFAELPEPEYILKSPDEIALSPECEELRALLRKDGIYDTVLAALGDQQMETLYWWMTKPDQFISDTNIVYNSPDYLKFLSQFIPGYVLYRNKWDRNQLGIELRNFINSWNQPEVDRKTRLKKCVSCGYNITDLFAMKLTADNILDDTPVSVVCPHCNTTNFVIYDPIAYKNRYSYE